MGIVVACFNVIFVASLFICIYIYLKRDTMKDIWSVITNIITFIESYLLTKLFNFAIGPKIVGFFESIANKSLKIDEEWAKSESVGDFINFVSTIIVSLLAFFLIFVVFYFVNHFIKKIIFKKIHKQKYSKYEPKKNNKIVGACLGFVSFSIVTFSILYPLGALVDITHTSANYVGYNFSKNEKTILENTILKIYSGVGSKDFFNNMTYFKASNGDVKNSEEIEGLFTISYALLNISNDKDVMSNTKKIKNSLTNTYLLPSLISEICSNAAIRFKNNQPFMGKTLKIPNDASKEFYVETLEVVSKWNKDSLIENIDTIFELYDILYSNNLLEATKTDDLINVISKDEFNERLFLCLFTNKDLKTVLPKFMNYGLSSLFEKLNIKTNNKNFIDLEYFNNLTEDDIKNEAKIFSLIVRQFVKIDSYNGKDIPKDEFTEILNNLAEIQNSKIFTNVIYNTLFELLGN